MAFPQTARSLSGEEEERERDRKAIGGQLRGLGSQGIAEGLRLPTDVPPPARPVWGPGTWMAKVPSTMVQKMGFRKMPSKTLRSPWILRALISLKSCIMTKVLKMMV